jgi:hypothetical protein
MRARRAGKVWRSGDARGTGANARVTREAGMRIPAATKIAAILSTTATSNGNFEPRKNHEHAP